MFGYVTFDTAALELAIEKAMPQSLARQKFADAASRLAAKARQQVMADMPKIFDRPTQFTVNSIRYRPATSENLESAVYISDDAAKGLSPRKYLGPQIKGGDRGEKRSERALQIKGLMAPDQRLVPSTQFDLNAEGNVSGAKMTTILSRLSAMGEQGYKGNVSVRSKRQLAKRGMATKQTGTDFFIARGKWSDRGLGIWQLIGKGEVRPALIFTDKKPTYKPIFHFNKLVMDVVRGAWAGQVRRALHEIAEANGRP